MHHTRRTLSLALALVSIAMVAACAVDGDTSAATEEPIAAVPGRYSAVETAYIGNFASGYVLGYLLPGTYIDLVHISPSGQYGYGRIGGTSHVGAWDDGHHCGWVQMYIDPGHDLVHGSGLAPSDICPPSSDTGLDADRIFAANSWTECDYGCVQNAVVLPTCTDFTVYANYDPTTHRFYDSDGSEAPGRGTPGYAGVAEQHVTNSIPGFGTRYVTADRIAVLIKDTSRSGDRTAWGFMHRDCIAGDRVGDPTPAAAMPTPPIACGGLASGQSLGQSQSVAACGGAYVLAMQTDGNLVEYQGTTALWFTSTDGRGGYTLAMQGDGNLVLYTASSVPLWASNTFGHPGAHFAIQDDGNLVVYDGTTPLWARFGLAASPPPASPTPTCPAGCSGHGSCEGSTCECTGGWSGSSCATAPAAEAHLVCCAHCNHRMLAYHANAEIVGGCAQAAHDFCAVDGRGGVAAWYEGACGEAP